MEKVVTLVEKKHKFRVVHVEQLIKELQDVLPQINQIQMRSLNGINKFMYVDCSTDFDEQVLLDILLNHTPADKKTIREAYTEAKTVDEKLDVMASVFLDQFGHYEVKS